MHTESAAAESAEFASGLLVSLPWRVVRNIGVSSCLCPAAMIDAERLPRSARAGFELLVQSMVKRGLPIWFTPAPELFTGPVPRQWLKNHLPGVTDHIALSDGETIRFVPGLRNHVFLYGLYQRADHDRFKRLVQRVPEFLSTFESQINTTYSLGGIVTGRIAPKTIILLQCAASDREINADLDRFSEGESKMEGDSAHLHDKRVGCLIGASEVALSSRAFWQRLRHLFTQSPPNEPVRVVFHISADYAEPIIDEIKFRLQQQWPSGLPLTLRTAEFTWGALRLESFKDEIKWRFVTHESWPFWQFPREFLEALGEVEFCSDNEALSPTALADALELEFSSAAS